MQYTQDNINEFEYKLVNHREIEELHCHNRIEIMRINSGAIRLRVDMGVSVYDAYEGDYAVIKSPDVHRVFPSASNCVVEHVLFPVSYQNMFNGDYVRNSFVIPKEVFDRHHDIKSFADSSMALLSEADAKSTLTRSLCASLCSLMLSLYDYRRKVVSMTNDSAEELPLRGSVSLETMEKFDTVLTYIDSNFTDSKINLPMLSGISGLGKTFLSALFPKLTGKNFTSYIHHLRINRSIELLTSTEKNISEIAYQCGFETIRSFNNVFKGVVGVSPSGFKAGLSGKSSVGLDTEISAMGADIMSCDWTSNVSFEKDIQNNLIRVICTETKLKLWCHLRLRMLFFKGRRYSISFTAKLLKNAAGNEPSKSVIYCDFSFPDKFKSTEHHSPHLLSKLAANDDFDEYKFEYTVPDYYVPTPEDIFSIYSTPTDDIGTSFEVKDISVKPI